MSINLLYEISSTPTVLHSDLGPVVSFMDLFLRLQALYGLDNKDLLEVWLLDLERNGSVRLYRVGDVLSFIAPVNNIVE